MRKKLMGLRNIKDLELVKEKRRNLEFWTILTYFKISGTILIHFRNFID